MADTFTSKLGLRQYDPLLNYDVSKFSADNLKIDNAFGTVICTSSTRPSTGLFNGLTIYETDTGRILVYNSGSWRLETAYILPVSSLANRNALTPVWDGFTIYRTDMDWTETYDGTAWRVPSGVRVSSTADITHPVAGQYCVGIADQMEYCWSGSAWQQTRLVAPAPVIERRQNATQAFSFGTDFKIPFDTSILTGVGISYASGDFTFTRGGEYQLSLSVRLNTAGTHYVWFNKSSATTGNRGKNSSSGLDIGASATVRIAPGEAWSAYVWSTVNNSLIRENGSADDYAPWFKARYLGPL